MTLTQEERTKKLADQHNTEQNARILITGRMVDEMSAQMRVRWHESPDAQELIKALIMALIKLGVIDCEKVIYEHINQGR